MGWYRYTMPTRDQVSVVLDLLVEVMRKAQAAKEMVLVGDQDYYTKRVAELAQAAHDDAEEAMGFLRLTQAAVPPEKRTAPGYRPPTSTKIRGGGEGGPTTRPTLRGKSVRPPNRGRGR